MRTIKIIFFSFIGIFLLFCGLMWYSFFGASNPNRKGNAFAYNFKTLYLESTIQKGQYSIIIDFSYANQELTQFSPLKIDSLKVYNLEHDTIKVYFNGGSWSRSKKLPILKRDSITFPENFCIKIYNQDNTKLFREIDFKQFEKLAKADYMSSTKNFLTAKSYTLIIDSTLLGLDKLRADSIK